MSKHMFWEALIITIFVFGIGILVGVYIENSRTNVVSNMYLNSEINLLDVQVQADALNLRDINCQNAVAENIKFGDKIYQDAQTLQNYEDANTITSSLIEEHKKYDLLRSLFWTNSIKIKGKCGDNVFHTLVYVYNYNPSDATEKSTQYVFSRFLQDLKAQYGDKVILIPIAKNLNLSSVSMLVNAYNINKTSVILDENFVVDKISDLNLLYSRIN